MVENVDGESLEDMARSKGYDEILGILSRLEFVRKILQDARVERKNEGRHFLSSRSSGFVLFHTRVEA